MPESPGQADSLNFAVPRASVDPGLRGWGFLCPAGVLLRCRAGKSSGRGPPKLKSKHSEARVYTGSSSAGQSWRPPQLTRF